MINGCWSCFKWGAVALIIAVVAGLLYVRYRVDDEIRRKVESMIAEHYVDLEVSVRAAELVPDEGIIVRGLSLSERGAEGPRPELVYVEEIFIASRTDLEDLLTGDLGVTHVTVRRPVFRATRRPDRQWSISKLLPMPRFGDQPVDATIENATVEILDPLRENAATYTLRDINVAITPTERELPDGSKRVMPAFEGSLSADFIQRIEFRGWHDPQEQRFSFGGRVQDLAISRELREALPGEIAARMQPLGSLRGQVGFDFRIGYEPQAAESWQFLVAGQLQRGRVDDPRLPYPVTDIRASFRGDNGGFEVSGLTARSGRTTVRLSAAGKGYDATSPAVIEVESQQLVLDRQLAEVLPPELREQWYKFLPAGEVNVRATLRYDGRRWRREFLVDCVDVSFSHHKFPYRLERGTGTIEYAGEHLQVRMTAFGDTRPVQIEADLQGAGDQAVGYVTLRTEQLPLDEKLFAALPEKSQRVVRGFAPRGTIDAYVHFHRDRPGDALHRRMVVQLNRIAVAYEHFPYPIQAISGTIDNYDDRWSFVNLEGYNDTGTITCQGSWQPIEEGAELVLDFTGRNLPLEQELRDALPEGGRQTWRMLRPSGLVDLASRMRYATATKQLSIETTLHLNGESVSIEPTVFPYRLDKLRGQVTYRDGVVEFQGLKAVHDRTSFSSDGQCTFPGDGSWQFRLSNLHIDRLRADRDLIRAVPPGVSNVLAGIDFAGSVNLSGAVTFAKAAREGAAVTSRWDCNLTTLQGGMAPGIVLSDINGGLRLSGGWDGSRFYSRGWLDLDSFTFKDLLFTQVRGPLWIDNQEMLFGAWAGPVGIAQPRQPSQPGQPSQEGQTAPAPQHITAQSYGGTVTADARVLLEDLPKYTLRLSVTDGDLQTFAQESLRGKHSLKGRVAANLELQGTGHGTHSLVGAGNVRLRDAEIYELPLVVSLLKILSVRTPDSNAFSTSDINFRVSGEHVYFDQINFYGDAISLLGKGEVDLNRNIRMVFHTVVGNEKAQIPFLRPVLGLASQQLMLIYVDGTLDNPRTTREALPGVRRAVEDLQEGTPAAASPSWLRAAQEGLNSLLPR